MDMWKPYIAATQEMVPDAEKKIVYDRLHIAAHFNLQRTSMMQYLKSVEQSMPGFLRRGIQASRTRETYFAKVPQT